MCASSRLYAKEGERLHRCFSHRERRCVEELEQEAFRDALGRFVRTYSFLSQVVSFTDAGLERDYRFCRALASFIKRTPRIRSI